MKIHLLSGFLGSGKTTAIQQACSILMQQGIAVGIITNDQGIRLVDNGLFNSLSIPNRQVTNGCFCCNYDDLDKSIQSLIITNNPDIIFAESVGSCTDIVATVMKPLLQFRSNIQVTISTFADARLLQMMQSKNSLFDETVKYIYFKQLEEAGMIVVSKIDLLDDKEIVHLQQWIQQNYSDKIVLYQNSLNTENVYQWLQTADTALPAALSSLDINYETYGTGEAKLAWLDQEVEIYSSSNNAVQIAVDLMQNIYTRIQVQGYPVGHLKFLLDNYIKVSYTSTTRPHDITTTNNKRTATLLINARVQVDPEILSLLVNDTIDKTTAVTGCKVKVVCLSVFKPGYPQPTYRM